MAPKATKRGAPASASKPERRVGKKASQPAKSKKDLRRERSIVNKSTWRSLTAEEQAKLPPPTDPLVVRSDHRPVKYDAVIGERICTMFATDPSMNLLKLNRDPTLPTVYTFYRWLEAHPDLSKSYARAREIHTDLQAAELEEIAAEPLIGEVRTTRHSEKDGTTEEVRTHDNVERTKVRVAVRQWLLAKNRPKKYGTQPTEAGGNNDQLTALFDSLKAGAAPTEDDDG